MKRTNYFVGATAVFVGILLFTQCTGKGSNQGTGGNSEGTRATTNLKIAYVDIDTLLTQYNFWTDLNEMMMKKEENIRATLNQKTRELEKDAQEFQHKYENNAFTRERAEQEHKRILKKQQDLQELQNRLTNELVVENQKNDLQLRDSINSFLKEYNKRQGYSFIISNAGFNNLLYADNAYNITKEIAEGLNGRYNSGKK